MRPLIRSLFLLALLGRVSADEFTLTDASLRRGGEAILKDLPAEISLRPDATGTGVFLDFSAKQAAPLLRGTLGRIAGMKRFTSCHRDEPFWMLPRAGTNESQVAPETQWLLAETQSGTFVILVPVLTDTTVFTLSGGDAGLQLTGETGDDAL